jgi:hypothetical protein
MCPDTCTAAWSEQWARGSSTRRRGFVVFGLAVIVVAGAPQLVFAGELAGRKCTDRGVGAEPADLLLHGGQFGPAGGDGALESFEVGRRGRRVRPSDPYRFNCAAWRRLVSCRA